MRSTSIVGRGASLDWIARAIAVTLGGATALAPGATVAFVTTTATTLTVATPSVSLAVMLVVAYGHGSLGRIGVPSVAADLGPRVTAVLFATSAALYALRATDRRAVRDLVHSPPLALAFPLGAVVLVAAIFGRGTLTLSGFLALFGWIPVFVGAQVLDHSRVERVLFASLPVLVLTSLLAAVFQSLAGAERLIALGYEYGTEIRETGGHVRAFGGMRYGIPFAHSMAVTVYIGVALRRRARSTLQRRLGLVVTVGAASSLVLALNRTALVALFVGLVALVISSSAASGQRRAYGAGMRVGAALGIVGVAFAAVTLLTSSPTKDSLASRSEAWARFLSSEEWALGEGLGSAGVSAIGSTTADQLIGGNSAAATDSYYVAIYAQLGALGVAAFVLLLVGFARGPVKQVLLARKVSHAGRPERTSLAWNAAAIATLIYLVVSMLTVNVWEDYPAPLLAMVPLGMAASEARRNGDSGAFGPD